MHTHELKKEKKLIMDWLRRIGVEFHTGFLVINSGADDHPIIFANQAFCDMVDYKEEEILGKNGRFLHGKKTDTAVSRQIRECAESQEPGIFEIINYKKNGTPFWNEITIQPLMFPEKNLQLTLMLQRDITDRKRSDALIKLQQETYTGIEQGYMLSMLLQLACDTAESFFQDDTRCTIMLINENDHLQVGAGNSFPKEFHEAVNGFPIEKTAGTCGPAILSKESVFVTDMKTDFLWRDYQGVVEQYNLVASWSTPILDASREPIGTFVVYFPLPVTPSENDKDFLRQIASIVSLTVKYSRQQVEILKLAYTDKETELPNRHFFKNELMDFLKEKEEGFIAFISAGEYIRVVDQYGHKAGDMMIAELGRRFGRIRMPREPLIARFSGSTIALYSKTPLDRIPDYLELINQTTAEPVVVRDLELFITLKIGVAIITPKQQDADELIRYADSALSKAKLQAGESFCYFENEHDEFMMKDLRIANELTAALRREEIGVHLQPKVDLETGEILSFEALARWNSPELGTIAPDVFIPAAEKNGKIRILEQAVLKRVLAWLKSRKDQGAQMYQVAINVSSDHFFHHSFIPHLVDTMAECGIEHRWIQLEITERIGFVDIETAYKVFKQLKTFGFTSSVDDFGTGYSSLSYLQKLPVSEIKIDRSFISNMHEPTTLAIVRTIVQLAENLNLQAVAEGIETESQREILLTLGCKIGQGYLFYRPMPLEEARLL
ncbi:EAL domain-containing protein [Planomicrobium sp. CPCC 101110]|uniref:bifunctional diguanylate cyclase/phosphodiesterase n=1 Tax=Planomicrobium sp. CPCC 101110 TaxID=2599619 RepID=UPI0011B69E72|nr:EAL domain-containing protein [Planomicrobium sp. CPCC 101110]TWT27648.1 EAL domain-containing protein [Planomicrobium sp. CPCC 101110]